MFIPANQQRTLNIREKYSKKKTEIKTENEQ
jgi:hypothetical protein